LTENGLVNKDTVAGGRTDKPKQIRITQRLGNRPYGAPSPCADADASMNTLHAMPTTTVPISPHSNSSTRLEHQWKRPTRQHQSHLDTRVDDKKLRSVLRKQACHPLHSGTHIPLPRVPCPTSLLVVRDAWPHESHGVEPSMVIRERFTPN